MMQRRWLSVSVSLFLLGALGCVAATVKHNRFGSDREVVAVNGQVYVVNKANGSVKRVDLSNARPFADDESDSD